MREAQEQLERVIARMQAIQTAIKASGTSFINRLQTKGNGIPDF